VSKEKPSPRLRWVARATNHLVKASWLHAFFGFAGHFETVFRYVLQEKVEGEWIDVPTDLDESLKAEIKAEIEDEVNAKLDQATPAISVSIARGQK
jgi:hypothetical protein